MTVGFFYVDLGTDESVEVGVCASALVRSVRETMPCVPVVQFTDETTAPVDGVEDVRRMLFGPMALMRFAHQAHVSGEWLFVDSDVLIQRDVRDVFKKPFDVAVTTRNWPHLKTAFGFTERMPFNTGVVFSRSQRFWVEAETRLRRLSPEAQAFMGHQTVICDMVADRQYEISRLKGSVYNCPPAVRDVDKANLSATLVRDAAIVHYKGLGRKALMLDRIQREMTGCQ